MEEMNIFEKATKEKLRFDYKGSITVEDLWGLSSSTLDDIYVGLLKNKKETEVSSLSKKKTTSDTKLELQLAIIKHIYEVKEKEKEEKESAMVIRNKKNMLTEILKERELEELRKSSPEEIKAMIDALDGKTV